MTFDKSKFIETFKIETREHIEKLNKGFLKVEKTPDDKTLLEFLMKEAHTIKGSATVMGFNRISEVSHLMEDGFEAAMAGEFMVSKVHVDFLFECLDLIECLLEDKVTWNDKGIDQSLIEEFCSKAESLFIANSSIKDEIVLTGDIQLDQDHKISEASFTASINENIYPKETKFKEARNVYQAIDNVRIDVSRIDKLLNYSRELLISKSRLTQTVKHVVEKTESLQNADEKYLTLLGDLKNVCQMVDVAASRIQDEIMNLRMLPISYLFSTFPRPMRDLAHKKNKNVELIIKNEDTLIDKNIIDEMKEPIMHLLRNAIDHGIEDEAERRVLGKENIAKIILDSYHHGSQIVIKVQDDGRGINVIKIKEKAVLKGFVSKEHVDQMSDEQVLQLLFTPGFSTKEEVTDISGRGVGLDFVRDKVKNLKGIVEIHTELNKGTTFLMKLPLTLSIIECLMVAGGNETFAIPIDSVIETVMIKPDEIKTVEKKEAITVRGMILPLIRLNELFGLSTRGIMEKKYFLVVILQSVERKLALLVDDLINRQEVVNKSLNAYMENVQNISGATILGDGRILFILDVHGVIESAEGVIIKRQKLTDQKKQLLVEKKKKTILLAEDAFTTAMLEKNILESVGYSVVLAKDGVEALKLSTQERFDLVITDVLMPRMDGFQLTEKLRQSELYKDTPIIIVTTREKEQDKRRGLEVGANAYILKKEFTTEGLLETIERII